MSKEMRNRGITGTILILVIALGLFLGGNIFLGLVFFTSFMAYLEYTKFHSGEFVNQFSLIGLFCGAFYYLTSLSNWAFGLEITLFAFLLLNFLVVISNSAKYDFKNLVYTLVGFTYVFLIPSSLFFVRHNLENKGTVIIALVITCVFASDSFAYLIGRKIGKTKIAPMISPKKSLEGLLGGALVSSLMVCVLAYFFLDLHSVKSIFIVFVISIFVVIVGFFGDLFESMIKRYFGVKDSSNFLPGHGGFLDRFDSLFMVSGVLYIILEFSRNF